MVVVSRVDGGGAGAFFFFFFLDAATRVFEGAACLTGNRAPRLAPAGSAAYDLLM